MVVAVVGHMQSFYDALYDRAEETEQGRLFRGYTTKVFNELRLPSPYYTKMFAFMREMGCVEQLKRGAKNTQSEWLLKKRPTEEDFIQADFTKLQDPRTEQLRVHQEVTNQRIRDLSQTVEDLQASVDQTNNLVNYLIKNQAALAVETEGEGSAAGTPGNDSRGVRSGKPPSA